MAARTAVVAGTATAVSGRVARRQRDKYAGQDAAYNEQQAAAMEQGMAGAAPAQAAPVDTTAELQQLAQLHEQGILTDEEFAAKKKQLLGI
jgi:hypothetical protein